MGWNPIEDIGDAVSSGWDSISDAASSGWDSIQDTVKDVTGIESLNAALLGGFGLASGLGTLSGRGLLGGMAANLLGPMAAPPGGAGPGMTGSLMGSAPAGLTMGAGGPAPAQTVGSAQNLAGLFGDSGYQYGGPSQTSAALLQANPEAYQYQPLMSGVV